MLDERTLTAEQIARIESAGWRQVTEYAMEHSAFYREHLSAAGFSQGKEVPLEAMRDVPPVGKDVLSERWEEFLCVPWDRVVDVVTTSGSTGRPLVVGLTEKDLLRLGYNEYLSFRCAGLTRSDRVFLAVTLDRCFIAGMAYWLGLRQLGAAVVRVGASTPMMHLDLMRRLAPTAMVGVPSFLRMVAERAAEDGVDLRGGEVTRLVCIGEPIRTQEGGLNVSGAAIEEGWGARAYSTYGITELAASLCECEAGAGGHIHPELMMIEALDERGERVGEGEVGELVATTFGVEGMPLIRYRTGDYGALYSEPCACGRRTLRMGPVVGRGSQKLKVKGVTLFPSVLQRILETTPGVDGYVIVARSGMAELSDQVEVRVCFGGNEAEITERLRERFRGEAKVAPAIVRSEAGAIERLQMPPGERKRRFFVDERGAGCR